MKEICSQGFDNIFSFACFPNDSLLETLSTIELPSLGVYDCVGVDGRENICCFAGKRQFFREKIPLFSPKQQNF